MLLSGPISLAVEPGSAAESAADPEVDDVLAGHSFHGEAFNDGPRQAAYLMEGMGNVEFPATTDDAQAQQFINQGVAQLHGFWYYEAERSFRQAAVLDPDCAISYWGMAMSNEGNRERAQGFIEEALQRREQCTRREQLYIDALAQFLKDEDDEGKKIKKKQRAQRYTRDLETIVEEFPDDIEAKAFLAVQLWMNARSDLPIVSYVAVDSIIEDIFDENPMHPAHHYRIHLWDRHKPERALQSAAACGPSLPGIAHMWHMPGHIYSRLHRYHDATWQQEASARVDHAHMMRDRVLPDQIHNFAHNNEWLIRNLLKVGRVEDALSLAKNMLELPRHPKYNTLEKRGSTKYGRERLLLTLSTYRLWDELIRLADTMYLEATEDKVYQAERLRYLGIAYALTGEPQAATEIRAELVSLLTESEEQVSELKQELEGVQAESKIESGLDESNAQTNASGEKLSAEDQKKAEANRKQRESELKKKVKQAEDSVGTLKKQVAAVTAAQAAAGDDWAKALEKWDESDLRDRLLKAEWLAASGDLDAALKEVAEEIEKNPNEVPSHAVQVWLQHSAGQNDDALASFEALRELAGVADLETPILARLQPLAEEAGYSASWAIPVEPADDTGLRPELDKLGPFRWQPYTAPDFTVKDNSGHAVHGKQIVGKPRLVIFYLGFGCLHCVEQLHEFSPRAEQFRASGIDLFAISSEDVESVNKALAAYSKPLDIPLHADPELKAFKAYRCFDDFEQQPLHGTFLIAPDGKVLWQDISYEPFMDVDFALEEAHRLLRLAGFGDYLETPKAQKFITSK